MIDATPWSNGSRGSWLFGVMIGLTSSIQRHDRFRRTTDFSSGSVTTATATATAIKEKKRGFLFDSDSRSPAPHNQLKVFAGDDTLSVPSDIWDVFIGGDLREEGLTFDHHERTGKEV